MKKKSRDYKKPSSYNTPNSILNNCFISNDEQAVYIIDEWFTPEGARDLYKWIGSYLRWKNSKGGKKV